MYPGNIEVSSMRATPTKRSSDVVERTMKVRKVSLQAQCLGLLGLVVNRNYRV